MAGQPRRNFTLRDAIVLVAATGLGFAWVRSHWYFHVFRWPESWIKEAPEMLQPLLMTWTFAILGLRLVPPKPPLPRLALQPGAAACGAVAFVFAIEFLQYLSRLVSMNRIPWGFLGTSNLWSELMDNSVAAGPYHHVVATAWGLLLLGRRCRPEPTWIDRAGRAVGLAWIAHFLWSWAEYVIDAWGHR